MMRECGYGWAYDLSLPPALIGSVLQLTLSDLWGSLFWSPTQVTHVFVTAWTFIGIGTLFLLIPTIWWCTKEMYQGLRTCTDAWFRRIILAGFVW